MEKDERFTRVLSDPKFRRTPFKDRKVKIDKRFQSMFKDSRFKVKSTVDKRGRPTAFSSNENFRKFYDLTSSESDGSESEEDSEKEPKQKSVIENQDVSDSDLESEVEEEKEQKKSSKKLETSKKKPEADNSNDQTSKKAEVAYPSVSTDEVASVNTIVRDKLKDLSVDYARGEGHLLSESSSSDEETESESASDQEVEHDWGELDKDADQTEESTSRLAVCNMDWDRVKAEDLMVLLSSFLPATGAISKVTVYPSEFGMKCMKEEEEKGPRELSEQTPLEDESGEDHFEMERLRSYELRRLKYYYAVVECDSVQTASHLYSECDGIEYESSSAKLDLRFIPEDTTFDEDPRDECTKLPEQNKYRPQFFISGALSQAKFELTWDTTDPRRVELSNRVWANKDKDVDDDELKAVLASSSGSESEEDEQDGEDGAAKYRALLAGLDDGKKKSEELEVSWGVNLQVQTDKKAAENRRAAAGLDEMTPFEQMMAKKREKTKEKRKQRLKKREGNTEEDDAAFSDDDLPPELEDLKAELTAGEAKEKKSVKKGRGKKGKKSHEDEEEMDPHKKAELELLLMDEEGEGPHHFNFDTRGKSKKKQKLQAQQQEDFQVDVSDPRFNALYTSHHYNVDPTDQHYKSTPGTQAFVSEKLKRRQKESAKVENGDKPKSKKRQEEGKKRTHDPELSLLVRNVKRKTQESLSGNSKRKFSSK